MKHHDPHRAKAEKYATYGIFGLFAAFILSSLVLGGDAINGRIDDGVYYIANRTSEAAVPAALYFFSLTLGCLALGGMFLLLIYKIIMITRKDPNQP